jgi:hypothetical protein
LSIGAAAFWIFLAAVVVAVNWKSKNKEAIKHETLRLLIEKNQNLDQAQIMGLLKPPAPPEWMFPKHEPGEGYRILRIFGTILLFLALGLVIVCVWRGLLFGIYEESVVGIATAIPILAMLGVGLFVASRHVTPPMTTGNRDKQGL